jgi:uncharacterized protein (DUF1499 family)
MLSSFLSVFFVGFISFSVILAPVNLSLASIFHFSGNPPTNLGVTDGNLAICPPTPNCVSSQVSDPDHHIDPINFTGDKSTVKQVLVKVLNVVPNTVITEETDDYIRTESTSKIFGFIDDAEFYFPPDQNIIQIRSAARLGESDLGVNRRRLEQIRLALQDLGINN